MRVHPGRPVWLAFAAGIAVAAVFAGPIAGGIWGWLSIGAYSSGGNNRWAAAVRIYEMIEVKHHLSVDMPINISKEESDCALVQVRKENVIGEPHRQMASDLRFAVYSTNRYLANMSEQSAVEELIGELPTPVLGALEGCISASMLSPICERYVASLKNRTLKDARLRQKLVENDLRTEHIWCFLARDPVASMQRRSLNHLTDAESRAVYDVNSPNSLK